MQELQRAIEELRQRAQRTADPQALRELEREARDLLTEAKNTPLEQSAQALFAEIAGNQTATVRPNTAALRGLLRRARIRIEIAGDDDDIDEAIDILSDALRMDSSSSDVINLLQQAGSHSAQARQRVQDLFDRHGVRSAPSTGSRESTALPASKPGAGGALRAASPFRAARQQIAADGIGRIAR